MIQWDHALCEVNFRCTKANRINRPPLARKVHKMNRKEYKKICSDLKKKGANLSDYFFEVPLNQILTTMNNDEETQIRTKSQYKDHVNNLEVLILDSGRTSSLGEPINEVPICVSEIKVGNVVEGYRNDDGRHRKGALGNLGVTRIFVSTWKSTNTPRFAERMEKEISNDHPIDGLAHDDSTRKRNIQLLVSEDKYFSSLPAGVIGGEQVPIPRPDLSTQESINKWAASCANVYKTQLPQCAWRRDRIERELKKGLQSRSGGKLSKPCDKDSMFALAKTGNNAIGWKSGGEKPNKDTMGEIHVFNGDRWRILLATSIRQVTKDCVANAIGAKRKDPDLKILLIYGVGNLTAVAPSAVQGDRLKVVREVREINSYGFGPNSGPLFDDLDFYPQITIGEYRDENMHHMVNQSQVLKLDEEEDFSKSTGKAQMFTRVSHIN